MVELVALEQAVARQRVKRAELSLKQAKTMLDESCGLAVSLALAAVFEPNNGARKQQEGDFRRSRRRQAHGEEQSPC